MEREMIYFLFLILFLLHKQSTEGVLLYTHRNATMEDAKHECESLNGTLARINLLETSDINFLKDCIPEDTSVWIQMVQKLSPWISIEGCDPVRGLNRPLHYFGTPSVSVCYDMCKKYGDRFGIMGNECYCGIPEVRLNRSIDNLCATQCDGVFCGGDAFVTVYRKDADDYNDKSNLCQISRCDGQSPGVRRVSCSATYLPACETGSITEKTTWEKAVKACLRMGGGFLKSHLNCLSDSRSEYEWIGKFRMMLVPDNIGDDPVMSFRRYKDDIRIEVEPFYENSTKSYLCDTMKLNSSALKMIHYRANIWACNTKNFSMNATSRFAETESSTEKEDKGTYTVSIVLNAAAGVVIILLVIAAILYQYKIRQKTDFRIVNSPESVEGIFDNTQYNAVTSTIGQSDNLIGGFNRQTCRTGREKPKQNVLQSGSS